MEKRLQNVVVKINSQYQPKYKKYFDILTKAL